MAYQKKPPGSHLGHPHHARSDPRNQESGPVTRGRTRREGIAIPVADERWMPEARSWFNSLKLSGQCEWYEASDWATATAAARALDISLRTHNASWFTSFVKLSERLAVTVVDRSRARIELGEPERADADEEAADNVVHGWQARLAEKRSRDDGA